MGSRRTVKLGGVKQSPLGILDLPRIFEVKLGGLWAISSVG